MGLLEIIRIIVKRRVALCFDQLLKFMLLLKKTLCYLGLFMLFAIPNQAEVKLPKLVSSGMVLQRDQSVKVWGWANPGETVAVTFKNKNYKTKTSGNGKWLINIKPQQHGSI